MRSPGRGSIAEDMPERPAIINREVSKGLIAFEGASAEVCGPLVITLVYTTYYIKI